ncbi:MAG: S1 RNA-binding domain-containing protein [bacterium]|nr:S1 RNA-binding domain-containing protein [bacterium]
MTDDLLPDDAQDNVDEFARLFTESEQRNQDQTPEPKTGDQLTGKLVQIGDEECFVDYGGRSELPISTVDLQDAEGQLRFAVGDAITAYVVGKGAEQRLALKQKAQGKDTRFLEDAMQSGVPLTGAVKETNKGGFVVDLGGHRAFCPISQIDDQFVNDPPAWVGRSLEFRVIEFADGGRRLVVSRRALLQEEKARLGKETRKTLAVGDVRDGKVVRLMPYGAFIDIGGVEGLVHVSEISHHRIADPAEVLQEGQTVTVKVTDLQHVGEGKAERVSLSIKALAGDPWQGVQDKLVLGEWVTGVVTGMADFGAFVELLPGVRGLVHVSALSQERVSHPSDVVREGQEVQVRIVEVDVQRKRISLSLVG